MTGQALGFLPAATFSFSDRFPLIAEFSAVEDDEDMAEWVKREYSKGEIDRYGASLIPWWTQRKPAPSDLWRGYKVIQNWRSSHALPLLTFRMGLTQRARRIEQDSIVAQRLKRFSSVMNKLAREESMQLSQMHDLGGCRAILSSVDSVYRLASLYSDPVIDTESLIKKYDYIENPKEDGYRGIHIIGRYRAHVEKNECWNGQRIEIQLRTQLQHAFSTAVETVTAFTREPLKFGGGPDDWRRFFSLVGTMFAIREGTPPVPNTPSDPVELRIELRRLIGSLKVRKRLRGWTKALTVLRREEMADAKWILLVLDVAEDTIRTTGFTDPKKAVLAVSAIETSVDAAHLDAVLVSVNSIQSLRAAYPNYYADTAAFVTALNVALRDPQKKKSKNKKKRKKKVK